MSEMADPPVNPQTPWEFLPNDESMDQSSATPAAAEEAAMHVEFVDRWQEPRAVMMREPRPVVHYLDDEHPEVPDTTQRIDPQETTAEVDDLLVRQHYLPPVYD